MSTEAVGAVSGNYTTAVSAVSGIGHASHKQDVDLKDNLFAADFGSKGPEETAGSIASKGDNLFEETAGSVAYNGDNLFEETAGSVAMNNDDQFNKAGHNLCIAA